MRYDHRMEAIGISEFSPEFYNEIDRRFLEAVRIAFPWSKIPFDQFIDYQKITSQDILEIGVGCVTNAQILSELAHTYTDVDLTNYAIEVTTK